MSQGQFTREGGGGFTGVNFHKGEFSRGKLSGENFLRRNFFWTGVIVLLLFICLSLIFLKKPICLFCNFILVLTARWLSPNRCLTNIINWELVAYKKISKYYKLRASCLQENKHGNLSGVLFSTKVVPVRSLTDILLQYWVFWLMLIPGMFISSRSTIRFYTKNELKKCLCFSKYFTET